MLKNSMAKYDIAETCGIWQAEHGYIYPATMLETLQSQLALSLSSVAEVTQQQHAGWQVWRHMALSRTSVLEHESDKPQGWVAAWYRLCCNLRCWPLLAKPPCAASRPWSCQRGKTFRVARSSAPLARASKQFNARLHPTTQAFLTTLPS